MRDRNVGLTTDPVFVGATRPPMRWGVTYSALLANLVATMEIFLLTRDLRSLLIALPVHGTCCLLCARDPRYFDLLGLWARTRLAAVLGNGWYWRASSYSPLSLPRRGLRGDVVRGELDSIVRGSGACEASW